MIRIFCGSDDRERIGLTVFCSSVWRRASDVVSITPIGQLVKTDGSNAFTLSRLLVPYLCDYEGWALWLDGSDMLCLADIAELWALRDEKYAVQVVKHDYKTRHPVKYLGQKNEDYPRKNWSSLMLINCRRSVWRRVGPEGLTNYNATAIPLSGRLHRLDWIPDEQIGALPKEWNHIPGEPNQSQTAKLVHFSVGLPVWRPYQDWEYADEWRIEALQSQYYQYDPAVRAGHLDDRLQPA